MSTILTVGSLKEIHDLNVESNNGINFIIDICKLSDENFESMVTIRDSVTANKGSWLHKISSEGNSAQDNFKESIVFIQRYIHQYDDGDHITKIHNPCNCPFVTKEEQIDILRELDIEIPVGVN